MDALQLLESSGYVAPPDDRDVEAAVGLVLAEALCEGGVPAGRSRQRARWLGRRRGVLAGAAAVIVAAAGTAIPLSLGGGGSAPATPVLQLASYSLRLPTRYHLTSAVTSGCNPMVMWASPPGDGGGSDATTPDYASGDVAAATAAGGCLSMVLAAPYTPTASQPDPEAITSQAEPERVGPYNAYIRTGSLYYLPQTGQYGPVETSLYVEIPLANGEMQDLVVGAEGLSQSQLLALVANGLSVGSSGSPAPTPTTGDAGGGGAGAGSTGDTTS